LFCFVANMSDDDHQDDLARMIRENTREWQTARYWRDKPVRERSTAKEVLTEAGLEVREFWSRDDDPPDCEGTVDGHWCGIEHTELVHEPTLRQSIKAQRERLAGKDPKKPEVYFVWGQADLLAALQRIIDQKDQAAARMKGGPYARYMLVIETGEMFLYREVVREYLTGASFRTTHITNAFLSLGYEHDADGRGYYPVFRLRLVKS
jgi:hypothetical protein